MYKKIEWPVDLDFKGERELEVPWVRRQLKGITGARIADFGCINYGDYKARPRWLGFDVYGVDDKENTLLAYDKAEFTIMKKRYMIADLMTAGFCKSESVDVGVSVSVIEHVGVNCEPRVISGDFIALRNMYDALRVGGFLLITVPAALTAGLPAPDIRTYTPAVLHKYMDGLYGSKVTYEYYRYMAPFWMVAYDDDSFDEMNRVAVESSKRKGVTSLACLKIEKR